MNRVVLVGRITRDPELKTSPNGVSFVSFSVAVNRQVPNAQGERVADFINCVAFNKQAENLARFIRKGGLIGVEGKLQSRTYQAQDGQNRYVVEVVCDSVTFLESRNSQSNSYNDYSSYTSNYQAPQQTVNTPKPVYQAPVYQEPVQNTNVNESHSDSSRDDDPFKDVAKQFTISDDDLPF